MQSNSSNPVSSSKLKASEVSKAPQARKGASSKLSTKRKTIKNCNRGVSRNVPGII